MRTIAVPTWQAPDSAVRSEKWPRPGPWLTRSDGSLVWNYTKWASDPTFTGPGPGMLQDFLGLADATNDRIEAYAQRWGSLDLCEHHLPTEPGSVGSVGTHPWPSLPPFMALMGAQSFIVQYGQNGECVIPLDKGESIRDWRYWSGQARSLAGIGLAVANRRVVDQSDVARLFDRAPWVPDVPGESGDGRPIWYPFDAERLQHVEADRLARQARASSLSRDYLRTMVKAALDFWITMSRVSLRLDWAGNRPDIFLTGGLYGALGIALMMAITGRQGFAFCSGCGKPHVPARPNDTRPSYCPTCRRTVPGRLAAARYGASEKGKRARADRLAKKRAEAEAKRQEGAP